MSLKYRIALTVFLLEAVMMTAILWQFGSTSPDQIQHEVFARTIVIAAIGMSLIALAGITIGFLLTRRLERLTGAAARLAAGETEVRVGFTGGDEVARLGRSFDTMADRIGSTLSALKSSEARNRVLVEYCPAAIFVFDPVAFRLVDVNQKWVELLKFPREKIVGMTPLDASPPLQKGGRPTDDWARELIARTFAGENPTAPWILRDSTGRDIPCELQLTQYPEADKNLIIGIIYDVSERDRLAEALDHRVAFEDLIVRLSARFIGLKPDAIDDALNQALGEIGRFAGVDRSYVFQFSPDHSTESCTHEWCAPGIESAIHRLQNLPLNNYPWFMQRIGRGEVLHVPQVSDLPPEAAAERAEFEAENIQSVIMVPLVFEGQVSGYMGFDAVSRAIEWPPEIVALLRIAGEIVFNALHRKHA
ncbi:MAG: HAMP domain-containing protein, partial [Nevskiales bacterium]